MTDIVVNGITVTFPFKPYKVQEEYMSKVIECLQNSQHGVLESPTGTGKTLSLLCSSLSWLFVKKAQLQAQAAAGAFEKIDPGSQFLNQLKNNLENAGGVPDQVQANFGWIMPRIIYASRTHSQLSQAMQELKRTSYKHVKVTVLGSRDQLCVHPEVSKEQNSFNKIHMCQAKIKARTCYYYNNIEVRKEDPIFKQEVLDIEDLVKAGQKVKCCPYYLSREMKQNADIVFMPYNYLLDPKSRKSQGIDLQNNVILLDEAHNVEKTCEEAASLQISSTDVAVCIDEITAVMKDMASEQDDQTDFSFESTGVVQKDFTAEDLCILKTMFLELEKAIDSIEIKNRTEGETYPGGYIFELLQKADITHGKEQLVIEKLDKIILYLTTISTSVFSRKGHALQKFNDLLRVVFVGGLRHKNKVKDCYKVHIQIEEQKKNFKNEGWEVKKIVKKNEGKLISYWCFSPGFGMQQLLEQGVRSIILTSGTLSPLKPFISEIGIPISVVLENPHIVGGEQLCVGILSKGPDGHVLNSSYNTRNDPVYIASLGRTLFNFSNIIPDGLLIFFPSYPILNKCKENWQTSGLWTKISSRKPIFVEPQTKYNFANIMNEFYEKIKDPAFKGAIFMAVCRGKVSEGLDFANSNGRAVLITGLPFPPLKDPRVVLKKRYLDENYSKNKEGLTGQYWYQLEALRAVNQAIGRIIRHKDDYGAIILCDCRFENPSNKQQLSTWIRPHIKTFSDFAMVTKDLRDFFVYARKVFSGLETHSRRKNDDFSLPAVPASFDTSGSRSLGSTSKNATVVQKFDDSINLKSYTRNTIDVKNNASKSNVVSDNLFDILKDTKRKAKINFNVCEIEQKQNIHDEKNNTIEPQPKRKKLKMIPVQFNVDDSLPSTSVVSLPMNLENVIEAQNRSCEKLPSSSDKKELGKIYLKEVKKSLTEEKYASFRKMVTNYTTTSNYEELLKTLELLFCRDENTSHLFSGFRSFIKKEHKSSFDNHIALRNEFV